MKAAKDFTHRLAALRRKVLATHFACGKIVLAEDEEKHAKSVQWVNTRVPDHDGTDGEIIVPTELQCGV